MIIVGVTGGIGSGKSLICMVFENLKVPVYHADIKARQLTDTDPGIRKGLISLMGESIYHENTLNRSLMADYVFHDKSLLNKTNHIIHPRVAEDFMSWCTKYAGCAYVVQESAILFESNMQTYFDKIITVASPVEMRIQRVITRRNMTRVKVLAIMNNQLSDEERAERSDYTIINDETTLVIPQVLKLHQIFTSPLQS
jgi:dephospho-CoA kinase